MQNVVFFGSGDFCRTDIAAVRCDNTGWEFAEGKKLRERRRISEVRGKAGRGIRMRMRGSRESERR